MAVIHDYVCLAHGKFEARSAKCPYGCGEGMVEKVFLKAPGMVSTFTKNADTALRGQVDQFGMTDVNLPAQQNQTMSLADLKKTQPGMNRMAAMMPNSMTSENAMRSLIPDAGKPAIIQPNKKLGDEIGGIASVTSQRPMYNVAAACDKSGQVTYAGAK